MLFGCQELTSVALSIDYLHTINEIFTFRCYESFFSVKLFETVSWRVVVGLWCEDCIHTIYKLYAIKRYEKWCSHDVPSESFT